MYTKAISVIIIISLCGVAVSSADTIVLKNGRKIVGDIVKEGKNSIKISRLNGSFVYAVPRNKIKLITKSTVEELDIQRMQDARAYLRPDPSIERARKEKLLKYRSQRYEDEVQSVQRALGKEKIQFVRGKFGVVEVTLNGKTKVNLIVDTGASLVVISRKVAGALGFHEKLESKRTIKIILADGTESEAIPITLDSVKVGEAKAVNISAAISKESPHGVDGLLGMSFLRRFKIKLDSEEKCLILERTKQTREPARNEKKGSRRY